MKRIDLFKTLRCVFVLGSSAAFSELVSNEKENAWQADQKCLHPPEFQFVNFLAPYSRLKNKIGINIFQPIKDDYQASNKVTLLKKNPLT